MVRRSVCRSKRAQYGADKGFIVAIAGTVVEQRVQSCRQLALPYADFVRLLQASAAHVYYSYPFVASWSLREALACGCAILGSDTLPVREFVTHDENGWLSPFHDPAALAERLLRLVSEPHTAMRLGQAGRRYAERERGLPVHFEAFDHMLCTALGHAPPAAG